MLDTSNFLAMKAYLGTALSEWQNLNVEEMYWGDLNEEDQGPTSNAFSLQDEIKGHSAERSKHSMVLRASFQEWQGYLQLVEFTVTCE